MCLRRTSETCEVFWVPSGLEVEECGDDLGPDVVHEAEVAAGDHDEAEHDGRCLRDGPAVRPLHALELGPAGTEESKDAVALGALGLGLAARLAACGLRGLLRLLLELGVGLRLDAEVLVAVD